MQKRSIRITLSENLFRKYKTYCAMMDISMTQQSNKIIEDFVKIIENDVKIINIKLKD